MDVNAINLGRKVICRYEVHMFQKQLYVTESWSQVLPDMETAPYCLWV